LDRAIPDPKQIRERVHASFARGMGRDDTLANFDIVSICHAGIQVHFLRHFKCGVGLESCRSYKAAASLTVLLLS
jgi:hypothetical protein